MLGLLARSLAASSSSLRFYELVSVRLPSFLGFRVGLLVGQFVGWLVGGWLVGLSVSRLVCWLVGEQFVVFLRWSAAAWFQWFEWLGRLVGWEGWLAGWLVGWMLGCLVGWMD